MEIKTFPEDKKEMRIFFDWLINNKMSSCYSFHGWALLKSGQTVKIGDSVDNLKNILHHESVHR